MRAADRDVVVYTIIVLTGQFYECMSPHTIIKSKTLPPITTSALTRQPCAADHLNWADPAELLDNITLLTPRQQDSLLCTERRVKAHPLRFNRDEQDYFANTGLLLMAQFSSAESLCRCSDGGKPCGLWTACPSCRYQRVYRAFSTFRTISSGHLSNLFFATLSLKQPLLLSEICPEDDPDVVWDACYWSILRLIDAGIAQGAFYVEEFTPVSFYPDESAHPHAHVLIYADATAAQLEAQLVSALTEYAGEQRLSPRAFKRFLESEDFDDVVIDRRRRLVRPAAFNFPWPVSVRVTPAATDRDLKNYLDYIQKPIGWAEAYRKQWYELGAATDRAAAAALNHGVINLVQAWDCATEGRYKVRYMGRFHCAHQHFLGTRKAERNNKAYRAGTKAWLKSFRADQGDQPDDEMGMIEEN